MDKFARGSIRAWHADGFVRITGPITVRDGKRGIGMHAKTASDLADWLAAVTFAKSTVPQKGVQSPVQGKEP